MLSPFTINQLVCFAARPIYLAGKATYLRTDLDFINHFFDIPRTSPLALRTATTEPINNDKERGLARDRQKPASPAQKDREYGDKIDVSENLTPRWMNIS